MKKIKKILLFIIMAILVAGILFAIAWQHPRFRDYYFREIDVWFDGPPDIFYQVWFMSKGEEVQVTCDGKSFEVLPDEWYDGTPDFQYIKDEGCSFFIDNKKSVKLSWTEMEGKGCGGRIYFPKGYCLGKTDIKMHFEDIHEIGICSNEDNLIIDAEINGDSSLILLKEKGKDELASRGQLERDIIFKEAAIDLSDVRSLQVRKLKDETPMVYLDLDGDGIYEYDCAQFTYDYFYSTIIGEFDFETEIKKAEFLGIYSVAEAREWVSSGEFRQQYGESVELNDNLALLEDDERIMVTYGSLISCIYNTFADIDQEAYIIYMFDKAENKIFFNAVYYDGKILESIE